MGLPYGEDVKHYWRTSNSSPDTWMDKARKVIENLGGSVTAEGFGSSDGRSAYMLQFEIDGEDFKVIWPVLPSSTGNDKAAKRQAATLLYHDIKAKSIAATVLGTRVAFFSYLLLQDGRSITELADSQLSQAFPKLLR